MPPRCVKSLLEMKTPGRGEVSWVQVFKCITIGDAGVGKSCLLLQFTEQRFRSELDPTIGCDCSSRIVDICGKPTKLQIWDTAGQELYSSINKSYYRGAEVAILVYDITRRETFDHVARWLKAAMEVAPASLTTILIGNKCDMSDRRTVSYEEGESFAKTHGLFFMESSAKTSHNVEEAFTMAARTVWEKIEHGALDPTAKVIFRGTYWARLWSQLYEEETMKSLKNLCQRLEGVIIELFNRGGWNFRSMLDM